jgi:hypothetical protein
MAVLRHECTTPGLQSCGTPGSLPIAARYTGALQGDLEHFRIRVTPDFTDVVAGINAVMYEFHGNQLWWRR